MKNIDIKKIYFLAFTSGLSAILIIPELVLNAIIFILSFSDFAVLKVAFSALFVSLCLRYIKRKHKEQKTATHDEIFNIPVDDIVTFLLMENGFPVKKACKELKINSSTHSKISHLLKEREIIKKEMPNNKLVLQIREKEKIKKIIMNGNEPFEIYR